MQFICIRSRNSTTEVILYSHIYQMKFSVVVVGVVCICFTARFDNEGR